MVDRKRMILSFIALIAIVLFAVSCSGEKKPENVKKGDSNDIGIVTPKKSTDRVFDDKSVQELPNSESGASTFAFKVAGVFVSTDVVQSSVFEKLISSQNKTFSIDSAMQRNASTSLSRITFSPMGIAVDEFKTSSAVIAVVGLSFESSNDKVVSQWKEIRMTLSYENGWKVTDFVIGSLSGPAGNGAELSPEFLASWSGYIFPANELSSGQKLIFNQTQSGFGTVDENGVPVTFPPGE